MSAEICGQHRNQGSRVFQLSGTSRDSLYTETHKQSLCLSHLNQSWVTQVNLTPALAMLRLQTPVWEVIRLRNLS